MPKPRRGKNMKSIENWRGTCSICGRTGVKLLWDVTNEKNVQIKVCKHCGK